MLIIVNRFLVVGRCPVPPIRPCRAHTSTPQSCGENDFSGRQNMEGNARRLPARKQKKPDHTLRL